jgi:hypothetical protein
MSSRLSEFRQRSQAGFVVPTVTLMLLAAMAIAGVAISASVSGQGGIVRDRDTKSSLAVAESGVERALLQYNRYGLVTAAAPCAPVGGTSPDANGWCPKVETTVNGAPVSYWVKPTSTTMSGGKVAWTEIEVIAVGVLGGVQRRVDFIANSSAGQKIFLDATVQSEDSITLDSNAQIHAGTATNGNINIASNAQQCGLATVGPGKTKTGSGVYYTDVGCSTAGTTPGEDEIDLPPVNQEDAATNNDNGRLFSLDQVSGKNKKAACFSGRNAAGESDKSCGARELVIGNNASVILGGSVYSLCKLTLSSNSALYIAPGKEVAIYFDSPEACGYSSGATQLELLSNTRITPQVGGSGSIALLFVGSQNLQTRALLNSNTSVEDPVHCTQNFVVYGPYTDIEMDSKTSFCGAIAGKSVHLNSNAEIWTSSGVQQFSLPLVAPHYEATRFVDCAATTATGAPDEGC